MPGNSESYATIMGGLASQLVEPQRSELNTSETDLILQRGMYEDFNLMKGMLLTRDAGGHTFEWEHVCAVIHLLENTQYTFRTALSELDGLSRHQAGGIAQGLRREDVIALTNVWHIDALVALRSSRLTPEMLLSLRAHEGGFHACHSEALQRLVQRDCLSIEDALEKIAGISVDEAHTICDATVTCDDITITADDLMDATSCTIM